MCWYAPTVRTCPTVQKINEENCDDECSSDDDCQYGRICCSNGCGGHTCSDSVEMCQVSISHWSVLMWHVMNIRLKQVLFK